jgi:hypothetical protein
MVVSINIAVQRLSMTEKDKYGKRILAGKYWISKKTWVRDSEAILLKYHESFTHNNYIDYEYLKSGRGL